jgi:hypothetical protein
MTEVLRHIDRAAQTNGHLLLLSRHGRLHGSGSRDTHTIYSMGHNSMLQASNG